MNWLRFFRRQQRDTESVSDIQFYIETETGDNISRGMPPAEARAAALRKFGNASLVREEIHRMNTIAFLDTFWRDILYALRTMRKSPAFAIAAVVTLALGIGANTAIFTVIRAVLLKPLEYKDPDRLVRLTLDNSRRNWLDGAMTLIQFEQMRGAGRSFTGIGAFLRSTENVTLSGGGEPETLRGARVSANFLEILGVQPIVGRSFLPEEEPSGGRSVAMISSALWKRRFGGDPQVSGKTTTLDSIPCTIIGVLPEGFAFPFAGIDVWVTRPSESSALPPRYWRFVSLLVGFGRLRHRVTVDQARAELSVLQHQYSAAHPGSGSGDPDTTMRVVWLKDQLVANVRPMLWILFGAVGFVLLIACANVASLLLARSASRRREFAVRAAIGAGRGRLIRQLLAESLVLAFAGGVLGALMANACLSLLARMSAVDLPRAGEIRLDSVVLGFAVALSIATGVLFGLAPSIGASRPDLIEALRASGEASRAGSRRGTLGAGARGLLVVGQVALSIVLLIGAALLMESFARLHQVDPGFQTANLLTMKIGLPPARYDTPRKRAAFFDDLVNRLESAPAVRGVAMAMSLPATSVMHTNIFIAGRPAPPENEPQMVQMQSITPGYFHTMGIPVRRGRELTVRDNAAGAPAVMVINEALARRFWPEYPRGQDPVGQRILEGFDKVAGFQEVVGIVADVHELGLAAGAEAEFYVPNAVHPPQTAYLALRTAGDPMRFVNAARSQVLAIDRNQPIYDVRTMDDVLEAMLGARRLTLVLLAVFAGVALLLAVVGLYGVISYSVAQRTQEVGIRRALGAQRSDILRLVLGQGLGLALAGVFLGICGAFALTRVMQGLLFHVSPTDPGIFAGIAILFVVVALAASYIPAYRATRIDPMSALR